MLSDLDFHLGPVQEIAVGGEASSTEVIEVLRHLRRPFRPSQVVAWKASGKAHKELEEKLPLLRYRPALGDVTTYVCEDFTCQAPIVGAGILSLGMGDFLKLISTVSAIGSHGVKESASAVASFGTFFLGKLWEQYGAGKIG